MVLFSAYYLAKMRPMITNFKKAVVPQLAVLMVIFGLILKEQMCIRDSYGYGAKYRSYSFTISKCSIDVYKRQT